MQEKQQLLLVDGSGYIFRAFHALPPMTRSDGTPVNAVYGFTAMLMKLVEAHALIAEVAIQLGVDTSNQEALGMINLLERMTDETAVQFQTLHKDNAEETVKS